MYEVVKYDIQGLERKIVLIGQLLEKLRQENTHLKTENEALKAMLVKKEMYISHFDNHTKVSHLANQVSQHESAENIHKLLDQYIQYIDECVRFLEDREG